MTNIHDEHAHLKHHEAPDADGRHIEGAADEIFSRAQDAVRDVADRAAHLAEDTLERGRAGVRKAERSSRRRHRDEHGQTSPFATALAVGAMGYAIATLMQGALRKRRPALETALPGTPPAAA